MTGDELFEHVYENYAEHVNPYLARLVTFAGFGVEVEAEGCYITDHEGRKILDFLGGYGTFALGHRPPAVIKAIQEQLGKMALSGKAFLTPAVGELAKSLSDVAPAGLKYTFFSNSGTEAVECALKLAKASTKRSKIVSTNGSYHGKTMGALSTTGREKYRKPFEPLVPGVVFVEFDDGEAACKAIDESTAAMIVEPVQGEGGIHVAPNGYLAALRKRCDETGTKLIFDEVQTGMGRTGEWFGCSHEGVSPDIMTLAKALGGGVMPIGATMGRAEIWEQVFGENPMAHTSTFGGNALACTAGIATIATIKDEGLINRSRQMGARLLAGLQSAQSKHGDLVSEVRGRGLMVGLEFNQDEVGELVVAQMLKRGVCVAYALNQPRVLRFEPPLIVTEAQVDECVSVVDEAITETKEILAAIA